MQTVRTVFEPGTGVKLISTVGKFDLGHLSGETGSRLIEWFMTVDTPARHALGELIIYGGTGEDVTCAVEV